MIAYRSGAATKQARRVAFVHDSNVFGGMEVHMLLLLRYFDRSRYTPVVYVPGYTEQFWSTPDQFIDEVKALDIPLLRPPHPGNLRYVSFIRGVINASRVLRQATLDVVHIHTNVPTRPRKVMLAARLAKVPALVRSEHLPPTHFGTAWPTKPMVKAFDTLVDGLVVGSDACLEEQVHLMGRNADKVHRLIYGIELDRFDPDHDVCAAKQRLGFDPALPLVGAVGRLSDLKGHTYLIDAAASIIEAYGPVNFIIVGDGPLRQELAEQVASRNLEAFVHFAGYQSDTVPYIQAMDIATMPTAIDEGISLAMLEFMAMRKPVVASDDPSFKETVMHERSGLIVPKAESSPLADAVLRLLRDQALAKQFAHEGHEVVHNRFNIRRQVAELMDLYDTFLGVGASR